MRGKITYKARQVYDAELDIEDILNCCLKCTSEKDDAYYILIASQFGETMKCICGPCDFYIAEGTFINMSISIKSTNSDKVAKDIKTFIDKNKIVNVEVVTTDDMFKDMMTIQEMYNAFIS